jgi:hypothetical protein
VARAVSRKVGNQFFPELLVYIIIIWFSGVLWIPGQCLVNLNTATPITGGLQMGPKSQNKNCQKMAPTICIKFQQIRRPHPLIKVHG